MNDIEAIDSARPDATIAALYPALSHRRLRARIAGGARAGVVLALSGALLFGGGALAFRFLQSRPGEVAADRLIPADAELAVTLDLKPSSAEQVRAYRRIAAAWEREGLQERLNRLLESQGCKEDPVSRDLVLLADSGIAFAAWRLDGAAPDAALLVSVTDARAAEEVLRRNAGHSEQREGLTVYELDGTGGGAWAGPRYGRTFGAVIGRYTVIAGRPATLLRVRDVHQGKAPSLSTVAAFAEARSALPADANIMVFLSPEGMRSLADRPASWARGAGLRTDPTRGAGWAALSATVREGGLVFDWRGPWNAEAVPGLSRIGAAAALEPNTLDRLPSGALGVMALAQPGAYGEAAREAAREVPDAWRGWQDGERDFERQTGVSVEADLLPGLKGDLLIGLYPIDGGREAGIVAVLDEANGAEPARLAEALRMAIEREDPSVRFASEERVGGRATVWSLEGADAHRYGPIAPSGVRPLWEQGRFAYARVGRGVVMASTPELLDRAIAAYDGGSGDLLTARGGDYGGMRAAMVPGAQWVLFASPAQFRDTLRPMLEDRIRGGGSRNGGQEMTAEHILELFGAASGQGLVASARYDGKSYAGSVFIPFDFDKAAELAGRWTTGANRDRAE